MVDVGGGDGSLLRGLLDRVPGLKGIVFDLPETRRDPRTFDARLAFVVGNFFDGVPRAGTYLLSGILHDWDDGRAGEILRQIRAAAALSARVLVLESVLPAGNDAHPAKWLTC